MPDLELHEYCVMFPDATEEEFAGLVEDIKVNGLLEPILLFEGKILDGRTRFNACKAAGVPPTFIHFGGDAEEAYNFVVSKNLHRRHLTNVQRAFLVAKIKDALGGDVESRAKVAKVPTATQSAVEHVLEDLPEFTDVMVQGVAAPNQIMSLKGRPERRKRAKVLLDSGQIRQLVSMLTGKDYRAFTGYRKEILNIKRVQSIPSISKVMKLFDTAVLILSRFDDVRLLLGEVAKAKVPFSQQEILKVPLETVKEIVSQQRQEIPNMMEWFDPSRVKEDLIAFYDGILDEMKIQIRRRINGTVVKEGVRKIEDWQKWREDTPRKGRNYENNTFQLPPTEYDYELTEGSDAADIDEAVMYFLWRYDTITKEIIEAVDVLTTIPANEIEASKASRQIPENIKQSSVVVPYGRPGDGKEPTPETLDGHFCNDINKHIRTIQKEDMCDAQ